jgi:ATP-dependent DNA helicase RecG
LAAHRSIPYNPDIANTFSHAGEIEAWGRGIERIIKTCKNEGFSTPEFRYDASGIWTIFKFEYPERAIVGEETTQKTNQKTNQNLSKQQMSILKYLTEYPSATYQELADNIPYAAYGGIRYNIARLQELGILKRIGGRKEGHWEINSQ